MIQTLSDILLIIIGFGTLYLCIPLLLLSIAGLGLGIIFQIVTPSSTTLQKPSREFPVPQSSKPSGKQAVDLTHILHWMQNDLEDIPFEPESIDSSPTKHPIFTKRGWIGFSR